MSVATFLSQETLEHLNSLTLSDAESLLASLNSQELQQLEDCCQAYAWTPNPGPQTDAYFSEADVLFYGGAAGGGKSDLMLGLALNEHHRSAIFRREIAQLRGLEDRLCELIGRHNYAASPVKVGKWNGRQIEFGGCQRLGDEEAWQGRAHDFKGFDELPHFLKQQFLFLTGWKRTVREGQRTRIVGAGNPPRDDQGRWVVEYFRPWLDPHYPDPAKPGELRWFFKDPEDPNGIDAECAPHYIKVVKDVPYRAESRTFIPARLHDNPQLLQTGYASTLNMMPEPLRSQLLYGDFSLKIQDRPWQLISTEWVMAAQARWTPSMVKDLPIEQLGADVARGGRDWAVLYPRHRNIMFPCIKAPGREVTTGGHIATMLINAMGSQFGTEAEPLVVVDAIGVGSAVIDACTDRLRRFVGMNVSNKCPYLDRMRKFKFKNMRAYIMWLLREALDPEGPDPLCLPPDPGLLGELTAIDWHLATEGISVDDKDTIKERIGRSPDHLDAMAFSVAPGAEGGQGMMDFMRALVQAEAEKRAAAAAASTTNSVNREQAAPDKPEPPIGLLDWHKTQR